MCVWIVGLNVDYWVKTEKVWSSPGVFKDLYRQTTIVKNGFKV